MKTKAEIAAWEAKKRLAAEVIEAKEKSDREPPKCQICGSGKGVEKSGERWECAGCRMEATR